MNIVLKQECLRFNRLIDVVKKSLVNVCKALDGEVVMSKELEILADNIFDVQVPGLWKSVSYPSLKPLGSYVEDLVKRLNFFNEWIANGIPHTYWVSGFYFTQSFLTGTLQNHARRNKISIDQLVFNFEIVSNINKDHKESPKTGCYVYGLYLDGAGWDNTTNILCESKPKQLYTSMPMIQLLPAINNDEYMEKMKSKIVYDCPVYKTSKRAGALSTTGHSTNYVMNIKLPSNKKNQGHWVCRGVAMLCQLDN